jgi:hypothetical protein
MHQVSTSERISVTKPSMNDGMIVSEIITVDKIMDQNSHSNQKYHEMNQLQQSSRFDTMNTSPF